MKRAIVLIILVVLAFACCTVGCSHADELISTASEKFPSALEKAKEKAKELLSASETEGADDQSAASEEVGGLPLPSLDSIGFSAGKLGSTEDVVLVPTDDYAQGYVFDYGGEQFVVYFDTYSWRIYDSYKITNHDDIVIICQALINEHPVFGSDWESYRTAEDMAYEWEQHNLAYKMLPEDSHWREDAKDVDLDPYDQGKSISEIYESRTGRELDLGNYLPGE